MKASCLLLPLLLLLQACQTAPVDIKAIMTPPGTWSFNGEEVRRVIVRSYEAKSAVITSHTAGTIDVSAIPSGGTMGYHSPDPDWKETPAAEWGMAFVARRQGHTLVISSRNEIAYIHEHYSLDKIRIAKPAHVTVELQKRPGSGDGAPALRREGGFFGR